MNSLLKFITVAFITLIIGLTGLFTYLQIARSRTIDQNLVTRLTTHLDTVTIDKVTRKLF